MAGVELKFTRASSQRRIKRILRALGSPMTLIQLCDVEPMAKATAKNYISYLRNEGEIYVSGRVVKPGGQTLIYMVVGRDI